MDLPTKITPELAEETGLHIGDGTMNYYKPDKKFRGSYALRGHIEDDRPHYENHIKRLYEELYNFTPNIKPMPSTRVFGFQKWSSDLVRFKHKKLGLPLGKKLEINILPKLRRTDELKAALIRGVFDTDDCLYLEPKRNRLYPRLQICTICPGLANTIKRMIIELKLKPTLYVSKEYRKNRKDLFRSVLRGDKNLHKFMDIIQPANLKHQKKYKFYITSS